MFFCPCFEMKQGLFLFNVNQTLKYVIFASYI